MRKKIRILDIILILLFLIGAGILSYPTISDLWNQYRNSKIASEYSDTVSDFSEKDIEQIWKDAREYNEKHKVNEILEVFDEDNEYELTHPYDSLLNPMGNEVMGYLEIPKIQCKIAIYHGVGSDVLEEGCGHVEGTSLPVGGKGSHSVLAAHRGLPSAKLFTNLDLLEKGDIFIITVLDEKMAYEVDQIKTVLPTETKDLAIDPESDYVTLLTCTPYGVNTHRLLVRGHRVPYEDVQDGQLSSESASTGRLAVLLLFAGFGTVTLLIIIIIIVCKLSDNKKK